LPIPEFDETKDKLVLALLAYSRHPDIAQKFIDYAHSEKGRAIFEKHGLY